MVASFLLYDFFYPKKICQDVNGQMIPVSFRSRLATFKLLFTLVGLQLEDFRKRLKEKESLLEKKAKIVATNATGKRQLETEVTEMKDQIDLKDRKISLLQRKVGYQFWLLLRTIRVY